MGESSPKDVREISKFAEEYARAFQRRDVAAICQLLANDFVAMTADKPPIRGRDAVRAELTNDLAGLEIDEIVFECEQIVVTGEWAWAAGLSRVMLNFDGDISQIDGKFLWILRRTPEGWRLVRDSASSH